VNADLPAVNATVIGNDISCQLSMKAVTQFESKTNYPSCLLRFSMTIRNLN